MATRPRPAPIPNPNATKNKPSQPRYAVDVNGVNETIDTYALRPGDGARGEGVRFRIPPGAKLELFDTQTRHAPKDVLVRKVGKDLHIAFPGSKIETPDAIVQGFYDGSNASDRLIGKGVDGVYHPYASSSGKSTDGVASLADNAFASQALAKTTVEPWGVAAGSTPSTVQATAPISRDAVPLATAEAAPTPAPPPGGGVSKEGLGISMSTLGWAAGGVLLVGAAAAGGGGGGGGDTTPSPGPSPSPAAEGPAVQSIQGAGATEGKPLTFTVTLAAPTSSTSSYTLTLGGTATAGTDFQAQPTFDNPNITYDAASGKVTVPAGITAFNISFNTVADTAPEGAETLQIGLGNATHTASMTDAGGATVQTVTGGGNVKEGATATFTITLSQPSDTDQQHTVAFTGAGVTDADIAGIKFTNGVTYDPVTHTITVPKGTPASFQMTVTLADDKLIEGNESMAVTVGGVNANAPLVIADSSAAQQVTGVAGPANVAEGGEAKYTVNLNAASSTATTYDIALIGGGGATAADHGAVTFSNGVTLANGKVTVPAGVTSFTVSTTITDDTDKDPGETFVLTVGGKNSNTTAITDNDAGAVVNSVTPNAAAVTEGGAITYTVTLSGPSAAGQTFDIATGGSATGADLGTTTLSNGVTVAGGQVTVPAGVTTFTVTIPTVDDKVPEPGGETLTLSVGGKASPATTINDAAGGTPATVIDVKSGVDTVVEGQAVTYTVTLSGSATGGETFKLEIPPNASYTGDDIGTASVNGAAFDPNTSVITVAPGTKTFTVTIPIRTDTVTGENDTLTILVGGKLSDFTLITDPPSTGTLADALPHQAQTDALQATAPESTDSLAPSLSADNELIDVLSILASPSGNTLMTLNGSNFTAQTLSAAPVAELLANIAFHDPAQQAAVVHDTNAPGQASVFSATQNPTSSEAHTAASLSFSEGTPATDLLTQHFTPQATTIIGA